MLGDFRASRTTENRAAVERYAEACVIITVCWPFLVGCTLKLCPRWVKEVGTIAVDKYWRLYMNPEWIASLHPAKLALIIVGHELQHALGNHADRLTQYNDVFLVSEDGNQCSVANCAHDLAINCGLQSFITSAEKYQEAVRAVDQIIRFKMPKEGLYPSQFMTPDKKPFPNGLVSESYAELIMKTFKPQPKMKCAAVSGKKGDPDQEGNASGQGKSSVMSGRCGSGAGGEKAAYEDAEAPSNEDPNSGVTPEEQELQRIRTARAIQEQSSRVRGSIPGGMELWAKVYLEKSKVPWDRLLRNSVRSSLNKLMGMSDYSYAIPNRRHSNSPVIMPGMYKPDPSFVVCLDTSGSMGNKDYSKAFGHIAAVIKTVGSRKVPVFSCDARASEIQWITDIKQFKLIGGGGTDMGVAIQKAHEYGRIRLLIVITDGETPWPAHQVGNLDVIACLTRKPHMSSPPSWITTIIQDT